MINYYSNLIHIYFDLIIPFGIPRLIPWPTSTQQAYQRCCNIDATSTFNMEMMLKHIWFCAWTDVRFQHWNTLIFNVKCRVSTLKQRRMLMLKQHQIWKNVEIDFKSFANTGMHNQTDQQRILKFNNYLFTLYWIFLSQGAYSNSQKLLFVYITFISLSSVKNRSICI